MKAVTRNPKLTEITRGDIVYVYFPSLTLDEAILQMFVNNDDAEITPEMIDELRKKVKSSVQQGTRPAVVVSNDKENTYSNVVKLVPFTTSDSKKPLPTHISVGIGDLDGTGLRQESTALVESVRCLDKFFILNKLGRLPEKLMTNIDKALKIEFALAK